MQEPITIVGAVGIANVADYNPDEWPVYYKQVPTRAIRVAGPFTVTPHGEADGDITVQDGFLAIDARGYPYPISADEFKLIYGDQRKLDVASLPPTSVHDIAVASAYGTISKGDAVAASRKLLVMYGLLDENEQAPA